MGLPPRNGLAARGGTRGAAASHGRRELPDASGSVFARRSGGTLINRRGLPQNQLNRSAGTKATSGLRASTQDVVGGGPRYSGGGNRSRASGLSDTSNVAVGEVLSAQHCA